MTSPTDSADGKKQLWARQAVTLELPGVKVSLDGVAALVTLLVVVGVVVYLVTARTESLTSVIGSLNPKAGTPERKTVEVLSFWVPSTPEYAQNAQAFEKWLTDNNRWWGKSPMTNIREIDGGKTVVEGYQYWAQDPVEGGELIGGNAQRAIQNQAFKLLGVKHPDMIWTEVSKQEFVP